MLAVHRACARVLLIVAAVLGSVPVSGQDAPASPPAGANCAAAEHRQFDFWLGSWTVTENGQPAGRNRIERVLGGCALLESWSGTSGTQGHSLSFYDASRKKWHQTWVDSQGGVLYLDGALVDGVMTLEGVRPDAVTGRDFRERIRWSVVGEGVVRQVWDRAPLPSGAWEPVFDGRYERAGSAVHGSP